MNVEHLNNILHTLIEDIGKTKFIDDLSSLITHVQSLAAAPNDQTHQQNVTNAREKLASTLARSETRNFPPSWRKTLNDMELHLFLAPDLENEIDYAFSGNEITPATTLDRLQELAKFVQDDRTHISNFINSLETFKIGREKLGEGECEVSVRIPPVAIDSNLKEFGKEVLIIEKTFAPFAELATGKKQEFTLKTISSSDFVITFYLLNDIVMAGAITTTAIAVAVKTLISAYKDIRGLRDTKAQLNDQGAPEELVKGIEDFADGKIEKCIEEITEKLRKEYSKIKDKKRENEVCNGIRINLSRIAKRIDNGYTIETRMGELPAKESDDAEVEDEERSILNDCYDEIQEAHREQTLFEWSGEPILKLPEPIDNGDEE